MTNRVGPALRRPLAEAEEGRDKKRQNSNSQALPFVPAPPTYTFVNQGLNAFEMGVASTVQKVKKSPLLTPLPVPSPVTQSQITFHIYIPPAAASTPAAAPSPSPAAASSSSLAPLPPLSPAASKQLPKEATLSDGSIVRKLPNGALMRRYPNGKIELTGKNQVRNVPAKSDFEIEFEEKREQMRVQMAAAYKEVEEVRRRYLPPPVQFGNPPQVQPPPSRSSTHHEDADETDSNSDTEIPRMGELTITDSLPKS